MRLPISCSAAALLTLAAIPALPFPVLELASSPLRVMPGQELTVCAANVGRHKARVTLEFVNVRTGAIVSQKVLTLEAPGVGTTTSDPCISTTAAGLGADSGEPLVVGLVSIRRSFFESRVTASLLVQSAGPPKRTQTIPLGPVNPAIGRRQQVVYIPQQ